MKKNGNIILDGFACKPRPGYKGPTVLTTCWKCPTCNIEVVKDQNGCSWAVGPLK